MSFSQLWLLFLQQMYKYQICILHACKIRHDLGSAQNKVYRSKEEVQYQAANKMYICYFCDFLFVYN